MTLRTLFICVLLSLVFVPAQARLSAQSKVLNGFPHVRQKPDFCGEACLEMVLQKMGTPWTQDDVFNISGLDPVEGRGCATKELVQASHSLGFDVGRTWYSVKVATADSELESKFRDLHQDLLAGYPSIVCMRYDKQPNTTEHFRLIVGYDAATDEILYLEPAENEARYRRMSKRDFLSLWPLKYKADTWTVIRLRMKSLGVPKLKQRAGFSDADYAQHIRKLRRQLPGPGFTIVLQKPFVVVGDESPTMVKRRAEQTVGWAVKKLKAQYFTKDPNSIIDVWLFKDRQSYESNAQTLWGETPGTPYGYYSPSQRVLVMNIATGGGTLVHEIVHPFMEANFPDCPDWFNEGLASLYEQSREKGGRIHGSTNWRLEGLQQAIQANTLQTFRHLTTRDFYGDDDGTNYAMARYLCYYLQNKGLLQTYYHRFVQNAKSDPTGYKTLQKVLKTDDMVAFERTWKAYVSRLRFP